MAHLESKSNFRVGLEKYKHRRGFRPLKVMGGKLYTTEHYSRKTPVGESKSPIAMKVNGSYRYSEG